MQSHPIPLRLTLVTLLFLLAAIGAQAQGGFVRARVRSFKGVALIDAGPGVFAPKINQLLEPGNKIQTGQNGRVVISLNDGGSQITVLPNSNVILKNYHDAQTARELLDIIVGRVIVKIHHIGGKPNPYRLNSPAASIAVRGTEFIVDVLPGGETLVLVREGLVEVWPRNNPDNKRLVTPGGKVTVQPGGGISSAFPGPRRSLESVAQSTSDISPIFFSAFPDQHLDSLDNPAYAADFKDGQGRILLLPSISEPSYVDVKNGGQYSKDAPYYDYSVSSQLTFFMPVPGSRFVIGGGASALRTRLRELANYESSDSQHHGFQRTRLNVINTSIIAAFSFGNQGRTSVGVGIDRLSGDESYSSHSDSKSRYYSHTYIDDSSASFDRTRLTLGLTRRLKESMRVGLYYRHGFNSSDQETMYHRQEKSEYPLPPPFPPPYSYFAAGEANISTSSSSSELGIRFRASLTRRLFYGVEGAYMYERNQSRIERPDQSVDYTRYLARRTRAGVGLGFFLTSRILLNLDVAGGLFNSSQPAQQPGGLNRNFLVSFSSLSSPLSIQSSPSSVRGTSVSAHWSVQANPWRNLFLSTSSLMTIRKDFHKYYFDGATRGYKDSSRRTLYNAGLGWKFKPNFIAEYLLSADPYESVPSHSLRLRYTFNLGFTNEK
ncbi:MAG TPA: FecR family protein [Blastocatellia bacterium]|nr:FecR family protein [Blastocatellia bacterium]